MIRPAAKWFAASVVVLSIAMAIAWGGARWLASRWSPDPETIVSASLQSMRQQNRLVPFQARYVAVVTSTQTRFGLQAKKTLIMPGTVRYEVDLGKLAQRDLAWDASSKTLSVTLPPVEVAGPEVDLGALREYDAGGVLMALTDASKALDASNRAAGRRELLAQARAPLPMKLAQEAAARAIERSFAMPLHAAGLDAMVKVRFANQGNDEQMDRSRSVAEVYGG